MRCRFAASVAVALLAAGCDNAPDVTTPKSPGRYAGIGVFDAGPLWGRMKGVPEASATDAATVADDEHIIVVVDSHTGEVRQCGDHSGYCVAMKPWSGAASAVRLEVHANQLEQEQITEVSAPTATEAKR